MKIRLLQPQYPLDGSSEACFDWILTQLAACDESLDLIVTPEYSNAPGINTREELDTFCATSTERLIAAAKEAAIRCKAFVAVNAARSDGGDLRNTTLFFGRDGKLLHDYHKAQLPPFETQVMKIKPGSGKDMIFGCEGIRFGFITCFDMYFNEYIEKMASFRPDVIIFPSYQRGETCENLYAQTRLCANRCNAFVLRCSYSVNPDSPRGGCTHIADPAGNPIFDLGQQVGVLDGDIDPKQKNMRANGFGMPKVSGDFFVENRRVPAIYRQCGSSMSLPDVELPYPRICAHRGFNTVAPENTMPAFGAAVALGADEIEFDIRFTADGVPMVIHNDTVDEVTHGRSTGRINDFTFAQLTEMNVGKGPFDGLQMAAFEQVLEKFAGRVVMNIHLKGDAESGQKDAVYSPEKLKKIMELVEQYDCKNYIYIAGCRDVLETARTYFPEIARCCLDGQRDYTLMETAIEFGCKKLQFYKPYFDQSMIDKAHDNGIICNIFWADDPKEAVEYIKMGIDTILTNDFLNVSNAVKKATRKG
ncbi:MAG TPA: glycerophosphodiester phosphodiesterase family protein [Oscillospiraceae bacterium]|nr:glycerophosphodiester phosphodiesterase family protein [Oscillospiraceae bacterium]HPF55683.1 glycerophosphodiester phosphodiesterase family protein [Clostridiales bacterium]HPK35714.1 glycerophosphodiester phosphodiesterase family protein [Oscillospiraceae bacterium]HPR75078.1 glycerophosphodiester phosphodiesterase family protein [Oscillospiraceae bacterium]